MRDPLSELLRSVHLSGGIFLDARFTAPWCVLSEVIAEDCRPLLASPSQLIAYHFVTEGKLLAAVEGEVPMVVEAGEIVLLPRNDPHTLASEPGLPTVIGRELVQAASDGGLARARYGGGGAATTMICGFLGSEHGYNPLIATLPRLLKVDFRESASRAWIEASVRLAAAELTQGRLASSDLVSRLAELLFIEAVRHYAAARAELENGWFRGVADPQIARALALVHREMAARWTVEGLARAVAMSRSAFVDRFTSLVGVPPIRYLTLSRLQTAKAQLRETRRTMAQLAHGLGYESEEAFSRAFKREFGLPPTHWRDGQPVARVPALDPARPSGHGSSDGLVDLG